MDLRGTGATELVALRNSGEVNGYFEQAREEVQKLTSVSYTHLTLPTKA